MASSRPAQSLQVGDRVVIGTLSPWRGGLLEPLRGVQGVIVRILPGELEAAVVFDGYLQADGASYGHSGTFVLIVDELVPVLPLLATPPETTPDD